MKRRRILRAAARIGSEQSGSFTLEAALAFPVMLLAVIALLSFSFMLFNRSDLYATTAAAADRTAFAWDNSAKDLITGAYPTGQTDGLYWRTGSDSFSDALSFLVRNDASRIDLPVRNAGQAGTLPLTKLTKSAEPLPRRIVGNISYSNKLYSRQVQISVNRQPALPAFTTKWLVPSSAVLLRSAVTEPVELIRTVDFIRTFAAKLEDLLSNRDSSMPIPAPTNVPASAVQLTSEREAAEYLRRLLGSTAPVYVTTPSGLQRKLDSLDPDGLFHEAKFGYTSKTESVEGQIAKDLELLRSAGQVKGVVWHFFRDSRNGKIGPSKPLRKELEKRGILVVIHT